MNQAHLIRLFLPQSPGPVTFVESQHSKPLPTSRQAKECPTTTALRTHWSCTLKHTSSAPVEKEPKKWALGLRLSAPSSSQCAAATPDCRGTRNGVLWSGNTGSHTPPQAWADNRCSDVVPLWPDYLITFKLLARWCQATSTHSCWQHKEVPCPKTHLNWSFHRSALGCRIDVTLSTRHHASPTTIESPPLDATLVLHHTTAGVLPPCRGHYIVDITLRTLHNGFSTGWVQKMPLGWPHSTKPSGTYVHIDNRMRCRHVNPYAGGQKVQFLRWMNLNMPATTHAHTHIHARTHSTRQLSTQLARKQILNTHIALDGVTRCSMLENLVPRKHAKKYTTLWKTKRWRKKRGRMAWLKTARSAYAD